jgi:hypothetical protein
MMARSASYEATIAMIRRCAEHQGGPDAAAFALTPTQRQQVTPPASADAAWRRQEYIPEPERQPLPPDHGWSGDCG